MHGLPKEVVLAVTWWGEGGAPHNFVLSLSLSLRTVFPFRFLFCYRSAVFPPPCLLPLPFPSLPLGAPSSRQGMLSCPVPACPLPQAWRGPPGLSQERPEATAALGCAVAPPAPSQEGAEATAALGCAVAAQPRYVAEARPLQAVPPTARGTALLARAREVAARSQLGGAQRGGGVSCRLRGEPLLGGAMCCCGQCGYDTAALSEAVA